MLQIRPEPTMGTTGAWTTSIEKKPEDMMMRNMLQEVYVPNVLDDLKRSSEMISRSNTPNWMAVSPQMREIIKDKMEERSDIAMLYGNFMPTHTLGLLTNVTT